MQRVLEQSAARFEQPFVIFTISIGQGVNASYKPCSHLSEFLFYLDYANQGWSAYSTFSRPTDRTPKQRKGFN
jgi:hypothetical protein